MPVYTTKRINAYLVPFVDTQVPTYKDAMELIQNVCERNTQSPIRYHIEKHRQKHVGFQDCNGKRVRKYTPGFWKVRIYKFDQFKLSIYLVQVHQFDRHFEISGRIQLQ